MQVKDVMVKEVVTVRRSTTLRQLLQIFSKFHIFPLVPVIEDSGNLAGIVSFRNLMEVFMPYKSGMLKGVPFLDEEKEDIFRAEITPEMGDLIIVDDIMEKKFILVKEDMSLQDAYNLMKLNLKEEFPVIDNYGRLTGMIGIFDIIRQIFYQKGVI